MVISIYGWSAKNMLTGKQLSGEFSMLPIKVSIELSKLLSPSTASLCVASKVNIPDDNEFSIWFEKQPITYK